MNLHIGMTVEVLHGCSYYPICHMRIYRSGSEIDHEESNQSALASRRLCNSCGHGKIYGEADIKRC